MSFEKVMRITEEERIAIKQSYNRTDEETNEDIQYLKDWLRKQLHLPQDEDETILRMMLYYNKFSLEKTKRKLDMYYSLKHIIPEFYVDREPLNPQISEQMNNSIMMPLPNLTDDLNRIILSRLVDDAPNFDVLLHVQLFFGTLDLLMAHDARLADQIIFDFEYVKLVHLVKTTPVFLKKLFTLLQKAYSDRIQGFHFIHVPTYAQPVVSVATSLISEKLASRIYVHKNIESLKQFLPPRCLPNEYGGTAGPLHELHDNWKKYYKSQNDWLRDLGNKRSDESKRIGEPMDSDIFGMCGSFRKINVD